MENITDFEIKITIIYRRKLIDCLIHIPLKSC